MTKGETKAWVQEEWKTWPDRHKWDDVGLGALVFYGWLQQHRSSQMSYAKFGGGDPYQTLSVWVRQWEDTCGRVERV